MRQDDGGPRAVGGVSPSDTTPDYALTRRRALVAQLGWSAIVVLPVAVLLAVEGRLSDASGLAWGLLISLVFVVSLQASFAAIGKELFVLGSPTAAARGVAIGFVAISAAELWMEGAVVGVYGLLVCASAIFLLATIFGSQLRSHRRRILIVGAGSNTRDLIEETRIAPENFEVIGIVDEIQSEACAGIPVLGRLENLPRVIDAERPDIVVVGLEKNRPAMFHHLLDHASLGFRVVELAQFYEHAFGRVPVRDLRRAWFMSVLHLYQRPYSRIANRVFDVTVASLGLVLVLPMVLVLPVLIRTTRGPVLVRQIRLGEHGKPFTMYKFRTMREGAEAPGMPVWAAEDDPRVTTIGQLMRRLRLDELPQLVNVLKGEMSIVGPRPERPEFMAELQENVPFWDRRHLIKPGITGWAQIRRGYTADADGSMEKLSFDLWYLRHRSLVVDFAICAQTIVVLLRGGPPRRVRRGNELAQRLKASSPYTVLSSRLLAVTAAAQARSRNGARRLSDDLGNDLALDVASNGGRHGDDETQVPLERHPGLLASGELDHPIAVLGAGPAGLTAAHVLNSRDVPAVVFEADGQVGGIAKTVEVDGYRFDLGGHRFFTKLPAVQKLWEETLGDELLLRPRLSRIYYNGQFFSYPLRASDVPRRLGIVEFARCFLSYLAAAGTRNKHADTFEEWVTNRFGSRIYDTFFRSYTEKVWGIPGNEIRSEWAAQRIKNLSLWSALLNAIGLSRKQITSLVEEFRYPRLGPGQMWESFRDRVETAGIPVLLEHRCVRLRHDGSRVSSLVVESDGISSEWQVDGVLSSIPLNELVLGLDPPPPPEVVDAARRLRYRDLCLVALMTHERDPFADNWIYLHDPETRAGRVQNFGAWSESLVQPGTTCLGVEYFCFAGDEIWEMPEDEAIAFATDELSRIGLIDPTQVFGGAKVRVPKAYPMYDGAYRDSVATIRSYLVQFENLQTFGRNGLHRYNNQDHSMWTAMLATLNLLDGTAWDVWSVNAEEEYHEEQDTIGKSLDLPREAEWETAAPSPMKPPARVLGLAVPAESVER